MPIYEYRCPKCNKPREIVLSIPHRDDEQLCDCGEVMSRVMSIPNPPIMKQSGRDMALGSLNSKETAHLKPHVREAAIKGITPPPKTLF